jgi:hypothetical protein
MRSKPRVAPKCSGYRTNVRITGAMGLTWKPRGGGRSTFDGSDSTGRHCGYATNISGPWTVYLTPWACGRDGGLVLGPFEDARDAMAAADEYAAGHRSDEDRLPG